MGRPAPADRLRRRRAADSREPVAGEESLRARVRASLLPLARAGQAGHVRQRAAALVRGGQAAPVHHPSPAARPECRGHPAPHRPEGVRKDRRAARSRRLIRREDMEIRVEAHGPHVAVVTIDNQPRRNAMSRQMMAELAARWDALEQGPCRAIVLTGAGERAFSAGADMSGDLSADPAMASVVNHALLKHHVYTKPIIAAVNGDCVGGGVELLLSTDIRAAAPHARFGLPEVRWSIYPFGGASIKLVQQIGYVHAMNLLLTARLIDAVEAARLGLVNRIVEADQLMRWALETAELIASHSPSAVQAVKQQISSTIAEHAVSREALDQELGDRVRASEHFKEGVSAFREKRPPHYR